jgi:hypothetical protein
MRNITACPVARPIEWPCPGQTSCVIATDRAARARTVSQIRCLFPPRSDSGGWQSKSVMDTKVGMPTPTGTGGNVRPRGHVSQPSSLDQPHQRRGRTDSKGGSS